MKEDREKTDGNGMAKSAGPAVHEDFYMCVQCGNDYGEDGIDWHYSSNAVYEGIERPGRL